MDVRVIDEENKIVKVEGTIAEYLNTEFDKYIRTALRMEPEKIIIELSK